VVFSDGTMLSVSGKPESVNERASTDQQKIHILGVRQKCRWIN